VCFVANRTEHIEMSNADLDRFIYGAEDIGRAADLYKKDGSVDTRRTFWALERGYIDADKFGRIWRTTLRKIRSGPKKATAA
jgi:hypothetical protein